MTKPLAKPLVVAVVGATAVGKTALAIRLAQYLETEIVSADSRQFYRELNIGTAKPTAEELAQVKHHFINSHSIAEQYTVGQYEQDALRVLATLHQSYSVVVVVGGSGLFVQAVCEGLDEMPPSNPTLREELKARLSTQGLASLFATLQFLDPMYAQVVDAHNPQRVMRALEVCLSTGQPYSAFRLHQPAPRPFRVLKIGLDMPREALYARIDARMDAMIAAGLLAEAQALLPYQHHNALQTVGYQEIFRYLAGEYDWQECVRLLKRNSRRYAKRQLTWFRRDTHTAWFAPNQIEEILAHIHAHFSET